jgi:hypothetical protein
MSSKYTVLQYNELSKLQQGVLNRAISRKRASFVFAQTSTNHKDGTREVDVGLYKMTSQKFVRHCIDCNEKMKNKDKECDKANCGIQQDDYESVELGEEHFTRPEPELSLLPEQKTARSRAAASGGSPSADRLAALERELNKLKVSVTALKKENATLKECITQLQEQVFEDEAEDEEADEAGEEADEAEEEADEEEE